ncbi:MAG: M28 family peptidase [Candidatus Geothermincolia bacterium]
MSTRKAILAGFLLALLAVTAVPAAAVAGDGTCAVALPAGNTHWYFAEGHTGPGFQEWLCVVNPNAAAAQVELQHLFPDGAPLPLSFEIAGDSRLTLNINETAGRAGDVSLEVTASSLVVAERPIYFRYRGYLPGCTNSPGATTGRTAMALAEGCTRPGFEEWLCILNPNDTETRLRVSFSTGDELEIPLPARSRRTLLVNDVVGAGKDVGLSAESDLPVVMERVMYFQYRGVWPGGHAQLAAEPARDAYFAEGYTGAGFEEWLCLFAAEPATVTLTYLFEGAPSEQDVLQLEAGERRSLFINEEVGSGRNVSVSVHAEPAILAERPLYFNYRGVCRGGTVTAGAATASQTLLLAEGTTRGGFEEWLCIANPGAADTVATIEYLFPGGGMITRGHTVIAASRLTLNVNDEIGRDRDVALRITAGRPLVAERSLYRPGTAFEVANAMDHLWWLSVTIGPRPQGGPAEEQAAVAMAGILESYGYGVEIQDVPLPNGADTHNVIASLPEDPTLPLYVVGGHYDSYMSAPSPGANDNGSGTVMTLELARCHAAQRFGANVRFVLFGGEEVLEGYDGRHHSGSDYYVEDLLAEGTRPDGAIILDMLGVGSQLYVRNMDVASQSLRHRLQSYADAVGVYLPYQRSGSISDHEAFEAEGIPSVWMEVKEDPYYHTPEDSYDKIDRGFIDLCGTLLEGFLRSL